MGPFVSLLRGLEGDSEVRVCVIGLAREGQGTLVPGDRPRGEADADRGVFQHLFTRVFRYTGNFQAILCLVGGGRDLLERGEF